MRLPQTEHGEKVLQQQGLQSRLLVAEFLATARVGVANRFPRSRNRMCCQGFQHIQAACKHCLLRLWWVQNSPQIRCRLFVQLNRCPKVEQQERLVVQALLQRFLPLYLPQFQWFQRCLQQQTQVLQPLLPQVLQPQAFLLVVQVA